MEEPLRRSFDDRQRARISIKALFIVALLSMVPGGAAHAANRLISIINPQGNFLAEGLGRLLHAGPSFGGQLVWNWEFAQALAKEKTNAKQGIDVDIVTQQVTKGKWPKEMGEAVTVVREASKGQGRIRIVRVPLSDDGSYLDKEESYPELAAFAQRVERFYRGEARKPSLYYAAYADGATVTEQLRKATGTNYIFHPHSLGIPKLKGMVQRSLDKGATPEQIRDEVAPYRFPSRIAHEKAAIEHAVAVIANSKTEVADQHRANYGGFAQRATKAGRFHAIPPGLKPIFLQQGAVNDGEAAATFEKDIISGSVRIGKARKGLPSLFTYARPVPIKNIGEFVRAVAMDPKLLDTHNVVVLAKEPQAGDAMEIHDEWVKLNDLIENPKDAAGRPLGTSLKGKIAIIGPRPQDDIAAILRHLGKRPGSVHVNPALYEAFGLTVVEAMASGLPVAATENGGPSEHVLVKTFSPKNHARMTAVIRELVKPEVWARVASEGKCYGGSFDWGRAVESHLAIGAVAKALEASPESAAETSIKVEKERRRSAKRERRGLQTIYRAIVRASRR